MSFVRYATSSRAGVISTEVEKSSFERQGGSLRSGCASGRDDSGRDERSVIQTSDK